jgi:gliding motility associated protien GldN
MKRLLLIGSLIFSLGALAQGTEINGGPVNVQGDVIDGVYIKEHIPTKRMIPYEFVREADVIWSKRVWRVIDMREKMNHPIYLPFDYHEASGQYIRNTSRWSLWTIFRHHILLGDIKMYSPYNPYQFDRFDGDQFKYPIVAEPGLNYATDSIFREKAFYYLGRLGADSDTPLSNFDGTDDSVIYDPVTGASTPVYPPRDTIWTDSKEVVQYKIKEDWFFDKERSVLDVRILGIAPVVYKIEEVNGIKEIKGLEEKYWLYFPHCRYILNNYFVYNDQNDAQWMSFDDFFWKRRFSSTIYKESNVFEREIDSYRTGVDALLESEKITEEIRNIEHDVWHF